MLPEVKVKSSQYLYYKKGYKYQTVTCDPLETPEDWEVIREYLEKNSFTNYTRNIAAVYDLRQYDIPYKFEEEYFVFVQGFLVVRVGYAWDGASGPAIDTPSFMRSSLIHDVLYQCHRQGLIPRDYRPISDRILKDVSKEDGMSWIRRQWTYGAVRVFGYWSARTPKKIIRSPKGDRV